MVFNLVYLKPERPSCSLACISQRSTELALFTRQGSEPAAVFKASGNVKVCVCVCVYKKERQSERERERAQFLLDRLSTAVNRRQAI